MDEDCGIRAVAGLLHVNRYAIPDPASEIAKLHSFPWDCGTVAGGTRDHASVPPGAFACITFARNSIGPVMARLPARRKSIAELDLKSY
jgi:hypothetical protein